MKSSKYIFITAFVTIAIFSCVLYTSCTKNKCGGTTCQNGGTCVESKCVCPAGYSGVSCSTGWSDVTIGTYTCKRSSCVPAVSDTTAWTSAVTKASTNGGYTVNISNFDNTNIAVQATIDSVGNMVIDPSGTGGIHASGNFSGGKINFHFTTSVSGGSGYSCYMVMTRN